MNVLKKGSKGEEVKILQQALKITPVDGDFGAKTDTAVKAFQKSKGLVADGVVGNKTWEALGITTTTSKCVDSSVLYSPLNVHVTKLANRTISYIAIHYTAGSTSKKGTALNVKKIFEQRSASADFCVDDETMVQFNPDIKNYYCWAVGDKKYVNSKGASLYGKATNRNTISIEMCSNLKKGTSSSAPNHEGWYLTNETIEKCVKLTKILMKKYNIPIERVIRHYDVTGKLCPGIIGWNNELTYTTDGKTTKKYSDSSKWLEFKKLLQK
jgi:N-acetyl-anhydromuramyl-L-alanine amidase AmpD